MRHSRGTQVKAALRLLCLLVPLWLLTAFWFPSVRVTSTQSIGAHSVERSSPVGAAYDGGYVMVWQDGRLGRQFSKAYLARMSNAGTVIDASGIALSARPFQQWDPAVSCTSVTCLVGWGQARDGVQVRTFDPFTGGLGSIVSMVTPGNGSPAADAPRIATDGTRFLTVWSAFPADIVGRFVSETGTLDVQRTLVTRPSGSAYLTVPTVTYSQGRYLVTGNDINGGSPFAIVARVVDASTGALLGSQVQVGTTTRQYMRPAVVEFPGGFSVVWSDTSERLVYRRFSLAGAVLDVSPVLIPGTNQFRTHPNVIFDGTGWAALWVQGGITLQGGRLALDGGVLLNDQTIRTLPEIVDVANVTRGPGNTALLSWHIDDFFGTPNSKQFGSLFIDTSTMTTTGAGFVSQNVPDVHEGQRTAALGDGYVVAYVSRTADAGQVWVQPTDVSGALTLGPTAFGGPAPRFAGVDVFTEAGQTRVARTNGSSVEVTSVSTAGALGSVATVGSSFLWTSPPALATRAGQSLIAWTGETLAGRGVWLGRVDVAGNAVGSAVRAQTPNDAFIRPAVTASSTQYAVAWASGSALRLNRVQPNGTVLDGAGVLLSGGAFAIASASNGTDFIVVWSQGQPGGVQAKRVSSAGTVLDTTALTISNPTHDIGSPDDPSGAAVIFDGTNYVVSWAERVADAGGLDVYERTVSSTGMLGPQVAVAGGPNDQQEVWVTPGAVTGQRLTSWLEGDSTLGATRVFVRSFYPGDAGPDAGAADAGALDAGAPDAGAVDAGGTDAGAVDASVPDAGGSSDAGAGDAGAGDASVSDGGSGDAGASDAGPTDAGLSDGGTGDAGVPDGGSSDAGGQTDGGADGGALIDGGLAADGGSSADAGSRDAGDGPRVLMVGCGCQGADGSLLLPFALLLAARRRRFW